MNETDHSKKTYNIKKKFSIRTFGCQMNVYDSERISEIMKGCGYEPEQDVEKTDILIINTCSVREKPRNRVISVIENVRSRNSGVKIVITGCVAQLEGEELFIDGADVIAGPDWYEELPSMLSRNELTGERISWLDQGDPRFLANNSEKFQVSAFIPIQKGCDNYCAYCVVPAARGPERSRPVEEIIKEVKHVIEKGTSEVFLLGQNVNSWKGEGGFAGLISEISSIDGVKRIRFTTSHPADISPELIKAFGNNEKLMPWLHLPLQSGSDRILDAMKRKYHMDHYYNIVKNIRAIRSDIALTTDIIVGFPGETEDDFRMTFDAVSTIGYEGMFSFKYSSRPDTAAALMPDHISEEIKGRRLTELQNMFEAKLPSLLQKYCGKSIEVLVDGPSLRDPLVARGRTPQNHVINFITGSEPQGLTGRIISCAVKEVRTHTLFGQAE